MKKILTSVCAAVLAVSMIAAFAGCSTTTTPSDPTAEVTEEPQATEDTRTEKEKILDAIESLNSAEVTGVNAYATSFEDMVTYLQSKGIIDPNETATDINTNSGFVKKYDGTYDEAVAVADKAVNYGNVSLIWYNLPNSDYGDIFTSMGNNSGTAVINGGQYTFSTTATFGVFAIAFSDVTAAQSLSYDESYEGYVAYDADNMDAYNAAYSAFSEYKTAQIDAAKANHKDALDVIAAIDTTPTSISFYTSITTLAAALQKAGCFTVQELAAPVDLNTDDCKYAPTANQYGKVTIYWFDTQAEGGWYSYTAYPSILASLTETKTASPISDVWSADSAIADKAFTVDVVYGQFAIAVAD